MGILWKNTNAKSLREICLLQMFILLVASHDSQAVAEDIQGLVAPFAAKGYKVFVFFSEDSIRLLNPDRQELKKLPVGVRLLACRTAAKDHGLSSQKDMIPGAEMSSLGELAELLEEADRCVFLGDIH